MGLPVYVMIGGRSSRFGADKATFSVDGEPWALHVGRRLAGVGGELVLVGEPRGSIGDTPQIPDAEPAGGPLAGFRAALADRARRRGPGLLVVASCDLVRPEAAWLTPLVARHRTDASLGVAAYHSGGYWQPFPCVAHTRWAANLNRLAEAGGRSLQAALEGSRDAARVAWGGPPTGPPQANTPDALAELLKPASG